MRNRVLFIGLIAFSFIVPWRTYAVNIGFLTIPLGKQEKNGSHLTRPPITAYRDLDRRACVVVDIGGSLDGKYCGRRNKTPGNRAYDQHDGTDFRAPMGTSILVAADGVVIKIEENYLDNWHPSLTSNGGGYGNFILIETNNGYRIRYAHLQYKSIHVRPGDRVERGRAIATSDNTGFSDASHLHFEIQKLVDDRWVTIDPFLEQLWITDGAKAVTTMEHVLTAQEYQIKLAEQSSKPFPSQSFPSFFSNPFSWFQSAWKNTKSWIAGLLGPPARALSAEEALTFLGSVSLPPKTNFTIQIPPPASRATVVKPRSLTVANKTSTKPTPTVVPPAVVPAFTPPTATGLPVVVTPQIPVIPASLLVPITFASQDSPPVIASSGGGGGGGNLIARTISTVTSQAPVEVQPSSAPSTTQSSVTSTSLSVTSTRNSVAFTLIHPIPDTRFIEFEWTATGMTTGTPRFILEYSPDQGGTWTNILNDTPSSQLIWEAPSDVAQPILRIGVIETNGQTNSFATSSAMTFFSYPKQVVINELAPWGTSAAHPEDEWIELMNTTGKPIDLTGWTLSNASGTFSIILTGQVKSYNYFVLEQGDENTLSNATSNQIYVGRLDDRGEDLFLKDAQGQIVDRMDWSRRWPTPISAGFSLMRDSFSESGSWFTNWANTYDGFVAYAKDRDTKPIQGSPGRVNHKPVRLEGTMAQSTTLSAEAGPYEIGRLMVASGTRLEIMPGTVLRMLPNRVGEILVQAGGSLEAKGTTLRPIVFTSYYDDEYGGHLPDAAEQKPASGNWRQVTFGKDSGPSIFDHVIIRYAGDFCSQTNFCTSQSASIGVYSNDVVISNSLIEGVRFPTVFISDASPILDGNEFTMEQPDKTRTQSVLLIQKGAPTIRQNVIVGGWYGINAYDGANPRIENNSLLRSRRASIGLLGATADITGNVMQSDGLGAAFLSGTLPRDITLNASVYWVVGDGDLIIPSGTTLTVEAGTIVGVKTEGIIVHGQLMAEGTMNAPIIFTSWKDEERVPELSHDPSMQVGFQSWHGIEFQNIQSPSMLRHVVIRYAGTFNLGGGDPVRWFVHSLIVRDSSSTVSLENVDIINGTSRARFDLTGILCIGSVEYCNASRQESLAKDEQSGLLHTDVKVENAVVTIQNSVFGVADYGVQVIGTSNVFIEHSRFLSTYIGVSSVPESSTTLVRITPQDFIDVTTSTIPAELLESPRTSLDVATSTEAASSSVSTSTDPMATLSTPSSTTSTTEIISEPSSASSTQNS